MAKHKIQKQVSGEDISIFSLDQEGNNSKTRQMYCISERIIALYLSEQARKASWGQNLKNIRRVLNLDTGLI